MTLVAAETKKVLRINTKYNLSTASDLTLTVQRPDGTRFAVSLPSLIVGSVTATDEDGNTLNANEYVTYQPAATDFPVAGRYKAQLDLLDASAKILTTITKVIDVAARIPAP